MLYAQSRPDAPPGNARSLARVQQTNPMLFSLLTLDTSNSKSCTAKSTSSRDGKGEMKRHTTTSSSAALSRRPSTNSPDEEFEQFKAEIHGYITQRIAHFRKTLLNGCHAVREWNRDCTPQADCVTPNAHFPPPSGHRDVERWSLDGTAMDGCTAAVGRGPAEDQTRTFNANSALMPKFKDAGYSSPSESVRRSTGTQHSKQAPVGFDLTLRTHQDLTVPANGNCRLVYPHGCGENTFVRGHDDSFHIKCYEDLARYSLTAPKEPTACPVTVETTAETEGISKVMLQQYWNGSINNLRLFASTEYPQIMKTVTATCAKNQAESPGVLQAGPGTTWDHVTKTQTGPVPNHSSPWLQNKTVGHMDKVPAGRPNYSTEREAAENPVELHSVRGTTDFPGDLQAKTVNQSRVSPVEDQSAKRNIIVFGHRSEPARPEPRSPVGEIQNATSVPTNQSDEPSHQELSLVYEDISDAENEMPDTKLKEINSPADSKILQYEDISDEEPFERGGGGRVEGPSRLVETNDGFEKSPPKNDRETRTNVFKDDSMDEEDEDYVVRPISILGVTFEPENEDLDSTETHEPEGGELEAADFPPLPVFDTQEGFLQATQCENVIALDLSMTSPEDDSCDTDNSCDYSPELKRNHLTAPSRMFVNQLLPPSSSSEEEDEGEEESQTRSGKDKLGIIHKLSQLVKQRRPKTKGLRISETADPMADSDTEDEEEFIKRAKRQKKKVKRPLSSDSEGPIIIIISSNTEDDDDLKYQTPATKRLFPSGPDEGSESKPVAGEREPRPPSAEPRPPSAEPRPPSAEPRPPAAESLLPQHQSEPHGTALLQTGPLIEPSVRAKTGRPRTMRRTPSRGRVTQGSGKVLKKGHKADPERRSVSGSGHSGEDLPAKDKSSTETVNRPCGAADASPRQQEGTSSDDSPGKWLESVDEEEESTLDSNPVIPRFVVVKSFRPDGSMRLLKEPLKTSNVSSTKTSSETNETHLLELPPKPAKEPHQTTKSKSNVSRTPPLPSQEVPSTSYGSLPSTSRQLPEASQSPAPSRRLSRDSPASSRLSSGDSPTSSRHSSGDSPASSRHSSGDGPASSRHLSGDRRTASRHLSGDGPASSRHLSGDGPTSSRHLSGDGPASSRHLSGDGPTSSRHLSGDGSASSRHLSGDRHTASRHLSGDGPASSRHLSGDGPASSRRSSGDGPASSRHLSGDGPASSRHLSEDCPSSSKHLSRDRRTASRHLSGDGPASSRHSSGDGPASSKHLSGDGPASSRHSSRDGPASSRRSSGDGPASSSVSRQHLSSSSLQRSQSYEGPTLNHSPPKGLATSPGATSAGAPSSALIRLRQHWKDTYVPTRRDRKTSLASRRRHNSNDHATPLMKKTMNDAKQWTKATNRDAPQEKRPYVPEGYKWLQKPTKGSRRRSESPSLIDKSETDFPSHWDPNYY